jgi:hypothetical protein
MGGKNARETFLALDVLLVGDNFVLERLLRVLIVLQLQLKRYNLMLRPAQPQHLKLLSRDLIIKRSLGLQVVAQGLDVIGIHLLCVLLLRQMLLLQTRARECGGCRSD